jgi:hypothetical protein
MDRKQLPRRIKLPRRVEEQTPPDIDASVWGEDGELQAARREQEDAMLEAVDAASRFVATVEKQTGWRADDPRFIGAWQALHDALELYYATSWQWSTSISPP